MSDNVVAFAPRPPKVPELSHVEVRLEDKDCALVIIVRDENGDAFALDYALTWWPPNFDLNRLRAAWAHWRGHSTVAS
jgi:hypothetical protein